MRRVMYHSLCVVIMWLGWASSSLGAQPPELTRRGQALLGGESVARGHWPEVAAVVYQGGVVACSGVLIDDDLVLTAAHCLERGKVTHVALDAAQLEDPGELKEVIYAWALPEPTDAAVLMLATPSQVSPRPLIDAPQAQQLVPQDQLIALGYGAMDQDAQQWSPTLRQATLSLRASSCDDAAMGCTSAPEFIAGGVEDGADTCLGDSGGPLLAQLEPRGPYVIAGLTVRGLLGGDHLCGQGGIYLRAEALREPIEAHFDRRLPQGQAAQAWQPELESSGEALVEGGGCAQGAQHPGQLAPLWFSFGLALSWRAHRRRAQAR